MGTARLGDSPAAVEKAFGKPEGKDGLPAGAESEEIGAPPTYAFPKPCDRPAPGVGDSSGTAREVGVTELRYRGVGVSYCHDRAFLFVVSADGSRTSAGAEIGQPLDAARRVHPGLKCGESTGSSTPPTPQFEYCAGKIGPDRYLWLGQDPVGSIAIATVPLEP